jgi:cation:H+ antiporter
MPNLLYLLIGLVLLWLGAELMIKGSQNISEHFQISSLFLGLTIIALGTSLPEIAISITGGFQRLEGIETSDLVMGNMIGSAFNQLTLFIGIIGIISILYIEKRQIYRDGIMLLFAILIVTVLAFDYKITFIDAIILMFFYGIYLITLMREEKIREKFRIFPPKMHLLYDVLRIILGISILYFTGEWVLNSAKGIADYFNIAESTVGILIIGLGTGMPELVVSLAAIRKKAIELSIGNLIGSNITDLLFSLGIGTFISDLSVKRSIILYDLPILFIVTILVIILMRTKEKLDRKEAFSLIGIYLVYVGLKIGIGF